jgi:hypothetical protein
MSDDGRFADSVVRAHWDLHTDCTSIRPTSPGCYEVDPILYGKPTSAS